MKDIIFYSLYLDRSYNSLKHSLLYFDRLSLPTGSFAYAGLEPNSFCVAMDLLPEEVKKEIQFLVDEGVVEILDTKQGEEAPSAEQVFEFIGSQLNQYGFPRVYELFEAVSLLVRMNFQSTIDLSDPDETTQTVGNMAAMIAAFCLQQMAFEQKTACLDHELLFDLVSLGLQGVFNDKQVRAALSKADFHEYKSNLMAQELLSLHLPSFEFRSFDDVLELKGKLRDEIKAFQTEVNSLALEIEKSPLDEDFNAYLRIFVENKINPQIKELEKKLRLSPSSFIKHLWKAPFVYASIAGTAHHLLPDYVIELAILGGIGTLAEEIRKEILAKKEAARNGLSLLLKV